MELSYAKATTLFAIALLGAIYLFFPTGYGTISGEAYDLALASYGACLAKSESRVEKIEAMLNESEYSEKLSERETRWFRDLIAQTRSGRWNQATPIAKRMMEDQVDPSL